MTQEWNLAINNPPPENIPLMTKIDGGNGIRNEQVMTFRRNFWWIGTKCSCCGQGEMYVYYCPTHWKRI